MKQQTKSIALAVARLCLQLPSNKVNNAYIDQILRSSASIGANYRAARRGKSRRDFVYKLQVVEEERDETMFLLGLLAEFNETYQVQMRTITRKRK